MSADQTAAQRQRWQRWLREIEAHRAEAERRQPSSTPLRCRCPRMVDHDVTGKPVALFVWHRKECEGRKNKTGGLGTHD